MASELRKLLDHQVLLADKFFKLLVVDGSQVQVRRVGLIVKCKVNAIRVFLFGPKVVILINVFVASFGLFIRLVGIFNFKSKPFFGLAIEFAPKTCLNKLKEVILTGPGCCGLKKWGHLLRTEGMFHRDGKCDRPLSDSNSAASQGSSAKRHSLRLKCVASSPGEQHWNSCV